MASPVNGSSSPGSHDDWDAIFSLLYGRLAENGECWEYTGAKTRGYGSLRRSRKDGGKLAHRYVWETMVEPIPKGLHVLHRCDNPPCVRPSHLWLGRQSDNVRDMLAKGRGSKPPMRWDGIHCKNGHELTPENTYIRKDNGHRRCKKCQADYARRYQGRA